MQITDELLEKVADLARLQLPEAEREALREKFQRMLDFVDRLQAVDTTGVEPLVYMNEEVNHLREDLPAPAPGRDEMLANAPEAEGPYFSVPKAVSREL